MNNAQQAASRALERVFRVQEHMHVIDWADKHFWLPPASSNNSDMMKWKTHAYQKLVLHSFCDLDTFMTVVKKPTQVGLSKCSLITTGYESAHRNRSNGTWLPTRGDANSYSNVQIVDMLEHVPAVREKLKVDFDKKDKDNTTRRRSFKGAQSYCQATQTLQDVSSISIEHAIGDEVSKFPRALKGGKDDVGKSPVDGIKGRLDSAENPCISLLSTPTEYGVCQITEEFENCRERFERGFYCPGCNNWHAYEWGSEKTDQGFKWTKVYDDNGIQDDLLTAQSVYYQCPYCPHKTTHDDLEHLDEQRGEWRSENLRFDDDLRKYYCLKTCDEMPSPYSVGIQIRGWFNRRKPWWMGVLAFITASREKAEGRPKKMVDWVQDYKAEAYRADEGSDYIRHGYLMARQEGITYAAECPDEVQAVTKFWDVQGDRIECLTTGWGPGKECWLIDHNVYWGSPATSDILKHAQRHTKKTYKKANGYDMPVLLSGIDSKYLPDIVNSYCRNDYKYSLIPTMGSKSIGKPLVQGRTSASKDHGTFLTTLCPDTGKTLIYSMYKVETPGPGYVHIPEKECFDEKFIKQMVAETRKPVNGIVRWVCGEGIRNEGLDMMVGNLAIMMLAEQKKGFQFVPKSEYKDEVIEKESDSFDISKLAQLARQ